MLYKPMSCTINTHVATQKIRITYCHAAPFGYTNGRDERGQPILLLDELKAEIIRSICQNFLKGYNIEQVKKMAQKKGLPMTGNSAIQKILVNPVYAGLVNVSEYKNQPSKQVQGAHEAIISEKQYWEIQERLVPKKYIRSTRLEVPLRGVIRCYHCGKHLTAARSKGRHGNHYWYYFCNVHRKENFSANNLHKQLNQILESIQHHR